MDGGHSSNFNYDEESSGVTDCSALFVSVPPVMRAMMMRYFRMMYERAVSDVVIVVLNALSLRSPTVSQ